MPINTHIIGKDNKHADTIEKDGYRGLYVVSNELKKFKNRSVFFTNPDYGSSMSYDFSNVVATEYVHNGEDNIYWTATAIIGKFDFSSAEQAHTGTQSIKCEKNFGGDMFQLEDEVELHSSGDYDRFVGWVYIDNDWINNNTILYVSLYNTITGTTVSNKRINLDNIVDGNVVNEWQRFIVGLSDFGTLSDDYNAIRFQFGEIGSVPEIYIDDLELQDIGGVTNEFKVQPTPGNWWHIDGIGIIIASNYVSTLPDSSMPNIPYNGLLGVPLVNGILYQRKEDGLTEFAFTMNHLVDILNQYNAYISSSGYDGNYTWIKIDINLRQPFLLKSEFEDYISFTLSDDLSGLEYFRVVASVQEENRELTRNGYDIGEVNA